jgi:hypothetical protein
MNSSGFVHYVYDPREEADRAVRMGLAASVQRAVGHFGVGNGA